ncbi:MAG: NADP-dependent oxidoreductase [Gammaproteobacteria bacterium]
MSEQNQIVVLKQRSVGVPQPADFELTSAAVATPAAGQLLCRAQYLTLDPYLRGKISGRHLSGAINPGDMMAGEVVSTVVVSNDERFAPGDTIAAFSGWQTHPVVDADSARKIETHGAPISTALGVMGMPGLTAYAGTLRLGQPLPGDRVLVSAAAGPVGSTVGQISRIQGAHAVGIAGSDEKCAWLREEAGFVDCINYKKEDLRAGIARTCPDGVNMYFDNVGGDVLQAAMEHLALGARVVLCGLMAQYNQDEMPPGPNPAFIIKSRATVRGLVVYDHEDLRPEFEAAVGAWIRNGELKFKEDIAVGIERAAEAFCALMRGENFGKALVRLGE